MRPVGPPGVGRVTDTDAHNPEELYQAADGAILEAKRKCRNKVVIAVNR